MIEEFIREMYRYCPEDARILGMQFRGDPNAVIPGKWAARPLRSTLIDEGANVYATVGVFHKGESGRYRRRKAQFAGGVLLMIDDVGDGKGSKFPLSTLSALKPTVLIETSPDNFQAIYMFDRLVTDLSEFNALIDAFVREKFLDQDTGMKGVTRVFRPPAGVNGKPKYGGWAVRAAEWEPGRRYSVEEICGAFSLELRRRHGRPKAVYQDVAVARAETFETVAHELNCLGMLKETDRSDDWLDIRCPWTDDHTGGVDNGAAIAVPSRTNGWYGGFRCHHGHCAEKGWRDLTEWMAAESAKALEEIGAEAPETWNFDSD